MASSDDVACSIYREILEKFLDQCCANKELASKLKLLRDQRETRKRFGDDVDEGIDSRPNSGSVGSAGRDSNVSIVMRIRELGGELKSVIDTVLKECEDSESLQAGALTIPEQDHELHNPPMSLVPDFQLVETMSAAARSNRLALREGHARQSVPTENTEHDEETVSKGNQE
ncbi:uncharacterized protein [Haliotis asinina]|uniref:uncharacterized protein isoform X2 n=1 Tax=Haliotis asinina TaxID=109174 RepID=UPI0035320413